MAKKEKPERKKKAPLVRPSTEKKRRAEGSHLRSQATCNLLKMYTKKPDRAKMRVKPNQPARIEPDRKWFGNTRVITQDAVEGFREAMAHAANDPFSVVLRRSKLPMGLLKDSSENSAAKKNMNLLSIEPFSSVFGKGKTRKRPTLTSYKLGDMLAEAKAQGTAHELSAPKGEVEREIALPKEDVLRKGTSSRIWGELYKVVDSSDILIQVLDARDPMGTRCDRLETYLKKDKSGKHVILLLNKADLIPTWTARKWVGLLSKEYPTIAFHASITNPFGKKALIDLLRQFSNLMKDRLHVSVGFIGYPNVGKSSVINAIKGDKVCISAPIPGETKVWQYVSLFGKIHLIDCPGIVPADESVGDAQRVLRGAVRAEKLTSPEDFIDDLLAIAEEKELRKRYKIPEELTWTDGEEFLAHIARLRGKLRQGGEPDIQIAARTVIYDWQRGRINYFVPPPTADDAT